MSAETDDIDAVLFDFGGVFTESPFGAVESWAADMGFDASRALGHVFGPYGDDTDHPWHRLERGEITMADARDQVIALAAADGIDLDPYDLFARMGEGQVLREAMVDKVVEVRAAGYRTGIITNNLAEYGEGWRSLLDVDGLFELVVDSSQVGLRKPDPRIYRLTLERLGGLAASAAVFLDDLDTNIEAARAVGMHGIVVGDDPTDAMDELDSLLGIAG